jgi:hypothetical protein
MLRNGRRVPTRGRDTLVVMVPLTLTGGLGAGALWSRSSA